MLEVNNLSKNLGSFQINQVSFHLSKGYIMGLVGANGAGKTTLIRILLDLIHSDSGNVTFAGMNMKDNEAQIKDMLGIVLGDQYYLLHKTARQNGNIYGQFYSKFNEEKFLNYLERFEVDPDQKLKRMSKGMRVKFEIAFALSHDAKLFIFDEPEDGLDQDFRHEFMDILMELIEDGERSVLISTHITEDLDRIADYITYMWHGKLLFSTDKDRLNSKLVLAKAEDYKIRLIPRDAVLYYEKDEYSSMALVRRSKMYPLGSEYQLQAPTIEDIMYCIERGGFQYVEDFLE